jgi:hypothetical protein
MSKQTSFVIDAIPRLPEEHEARVNVLRQALMEGENSGAPEPFDFDAFIEAKRRATSPSPIPSEREKGNPWAYSRHNMIGFPI